MINLTKGILITQSGEELQRSIKAAITKAKECICKELFNTNYIAPSKVTSSPRNEYYTASIVRLFDNHLSPSNAQHYDETWVQNAYLCAKKRPDPCIAKAVIPYSAHDWLTKASLERLSRDCVLILHFLWQEKAVLLPVDMKKPIVGDPRTATNFFEVAAALYTEVLALVRLPFVPHAFRENIPDITAVMNPSAVSNFEWNAWRMVRCTDWHRIEDIDPADISALVDHLLLSRKGKVDWFQYPMAPAAFWSYIRRLYPDRCQQTDFEKSLKNDTQATTKSLRSGEFSYPEEHKHTVELWLKYQDQFIEIKKSRGMKTFKSYSRSFATLNTYLFSVYPASTGLAPPLPKEFNRRYIDGVDFKGFISFLNEDRSKSTVKTTLYQIESLFDFMAVNANIDSNLEGFVNPIHHIDFPVVRRNASSTKPAFGSDHFPFLLQYCYAIESFSTHIFELALTHKENLYDPRYRADIDTKNWNDAHRIIETEKYNYVPIVFYRNPLFDPSQPKSPANSPMSYEALHLLPRFLFSLFEDQDKGLSYPQLNYIRHNIVALETGLRSIHIRWLEKRTYDKHIDRSKPLPPLCKLHINTDKVNDAWDATVSRSVIEVLDRQKNMIALLDDPAMETEVWYDDHEGSTFGKIISIFPKGGSPGVLTAQSYAKFFKRLVYSFDLFCRYQLGIDSTNRMPEALRDIDTIDDLYDYLKVIKLEAQASKLIEHTPHSCRVSVVSEYIRILPPHIIGPFITGHATVEHVIYYAKIDPAYLKTVEQYQHIIIEQGVLLDRPAMPSIKAEDITSKLQIAFRRDPEKSFIDFGAISFERETSDELLSGIKAAKKRPIDSLAFMPTHICPFANHCPADVVRDLGAVPGSRTPCGGCYYAIKTVDHLPRIHGHIRALTDECNELETHIAEAKRNGASHESLVPKANHRKYLASEIISWSVTAHCLEQMYNEIKTRSSFLIEKPEIVSEHLERIELADNSLSNLIARTAEAKSHAEFFTSQLKHQIMVARNKLLAFTGDFNRMLQEAPSGFTLIDEFRGLIRSACEVLGLSLHDLSEVMSKPMTLERPNAILKLVASPGGVPA
ncbi:hypothetical protein [Pseudomonas sp. GD03696]|uniref:hypothetical protein n=1 Tax=Pseudomonas sp. GD03696 TaxID=2975368 RepID=UPI00244AD95F|nr:hypothetical protein [Pseudomonas sp. GD03696]MDH1930018.1 hypothetical protein [Pseudomonas sp. GD03696]